ncbi:MAG TPA: hypothetical protein VLT34_01905 [Arthrobacter sp.]|nr:hypothetical protein [Arthrobacter sp.]
METTRSVWRSLRPVLLAAAAATTWLVLSAPAATASSDTDSLLTNATSSVTALSPAADPAGDILIPATDVASREAGEGPVAAVTSPVSAPVLSPVVHEVTRAADGLLQVVPVAPAASLTQLTERTEPVVHIADAVVGDSANSLLGVSGAVPEIVDAALTALIDPAGARGTSPVSGTGLELPLTVGGGKVGSLVPASADQSGGANEPLTAPDATDSQADVTGAMVPALPRAGVFASSAPWGQLPPGASADAVAPGYPDGGPLDTLPDFLPAMPAMPGSGSAGGNGSGAGPSTPEWLAAHGFELPLTTALPVPGALLQSPSPVSFDPGSSPD